MSQIEGSDVITPVENHPVWVHQTVGGPGRHYDVQHDTFLVTTTSASGRSSFKKIFSAASKQLEQTLPREVLEGNGSTAALVCLEGDGQLTTAHLGDSRVTLFIRDLATGKVTPCQLTEDHNPRRHDEFQRIQPFSSLFSIEDTALKFHMGGHIGMTRAFGDASIKGIVSDEAEVKTHRLGQYSPAGAELYLCVDTDGAHRRTSQQQRAEILAEYFRNPDGRNPAQMLADLALGNRSHDNITVLFTKIDPALKEKLTLSVFDGHGGEGRAVSREAARTLENLMHNAP